MNKTKLKPLTRSSYQCEVRAEQDEKGAYITGRPIVYSSRTDIGWFDEIIEPGALVGADLKDVRFLVNHDISKIPLARSRNNNANSTMQLIPDDKGLVIRVLLDIENNTEARNLYSAVQRGDISGMSFMFDIPRDGDDWENIESEHPTRHIRQISTVYEVSAVTFPAYEDTEIHARSKEALENARRTLENVRSEKRSALENADNLELLKLKTRILGGN